MALVFILQQRDLKIYEKFDSSSLRNNTLRVFENLNHKKLSFDGLKIKMDYY